MAYMYKFTQEKCRVMLLYILVYIVHRAGNDILQPHGNLINSLHSTLKSIFYIPLVDAHKKICTQQPRVLKYRARMQ